MSDALPLPPRPNLEQYKKLAKDFQHACKSGDPGAIRRWAARWVETLARLHGAPDRPTRESDRARRRTRSSAAGTSSRRRLNTLARCTLAGAQFFIAREHGFTSWPKFADTSRNWRAPTRRSRHSKRPPTPSSAATHRRFGNCSREHPGLVRERSTREHRSTLLHYVSANGVEDFRQKTPKNIVEITNLLLDAGADVDAESDAYGGGCTAARSGRRRASIRRKPACRSLSCGHCWTGAQVYKPVGGWQSPFHRSRLHREWTTRGGRDFSRISARRWIWRVRLHWAGSTCFRAFSMRAARPGPKPSKSRSSRRFSTPAATAASTRASSFSTAASIPQRATTSGQTGSALGELGPAN